jgi:CRP-like cAMP-binding protein
MGTDLRKLKDRANEAVEKGKHKKAAELFQELAQAEPGEPGWAHRAGEMLRKVGRNSEAITSLMAAATGYAKQGFGLKAVAVAKTVLGLQTDHEGAQRLLAALLASMAKPAAPSRPAAPAPAPAAPAAPAPAAPAPAAPAPAAPAPAAPAPAPAAPAAPAPAPAAPPPAAAAARPAPGPASRPAPGPASRPAPPLAPPPARLVSAPATSLEVAVDLPAVVELGPDEPLVSLPLGRLVAGARPSREMPAVQVTEIPLDGDGIEIGGTMPPEPPGAPPPRAAGAPPPRAAAAPPPRAAAAPPPRAAAAPPPRAAAAPPAAGAPSSRAPEPAPYAEFDATPSSVGAALGAAEPVVDLAPRLPPLPPIPLFSSLAADELSCLVQRVEVLEVADGEVVFAEGERGDALFVVVRGAVRVSRGAGRDRVALERLAEGACFGEVSLVSQAPRPVTVVADGDGTLMRLSREVIGEILARYPEALRVLLGFFRARLVAILVATAPLFAPFSRAERERLVELFRFVEIEPGATVTRQGELSPGLFILLAGRMDVTIVRAGEEVLLAFLGAGDLLGEMSLLSRSPAMATIRAAAKCWALFLPREQFHGVVLSHPQMLEYVGELVEQRRLENDATLAGTRPYSEGRLQVT